ncbi:MAG: SIMPL domain-containing protein [Chromatiales bacterium]|nr:SIMPL domain-containing protein [Chromatiales bacterium]
MRQLLMPLIAALSLAPSAFAAEAPGGLRITGSAELAVMPDRAHLLMAVQQRGPEMAAARARVVEVSRQFLALADRLGIAEEKVSTSGLNIRPEWRWDQQRQEQVFSGYFVQRELRVELADLDQLGELIEAALELGVNEVYPAQLDTSRRRELEREALALAAADARESALHLARGLGLRPGRVLSVEALGPVGPGPMPRARAMLAEDAAETYRTGEIVIGARVSVEFALETLE